MTNRKMAAFLGMSAERELDEAEKKFLAHRARREADAEERYEENPSFGLMQEKEKPVEREVEGASPADDAGKPGGKVRRSKRKPSKAAGLEDGGSVEGEGEG
jgi:hypothetical protein